MINFMINRYHTVRRSDKFWGVLWTDLILEMIGGEVKSGGGLTHGRSGTESVRNLWICNMHRFAGIHNIMGDLTGQFHRISEQHIELSSSRVR